MVSSAVQPTQRVTTKGTSEDHSSVTFPITRGLKPKCANPFYGQGAPLGSFINVFCKLETNSCILAGVAPQGFELINKNVIDPDLQAWIVPNFSTTTHMHRIVGSMMHMPICKSYFKYTACICGIPNMMLEGTVADWKECCTEWANMLGPVLVQFTAAMRGEVDADFWEQICHTNKPQSTYSTVYVSGWVTVSGVFSDKGQWQKDIKINPEHNKTWTMQWCFIPIYKISKGYTEYLVTIVGDNWEGPYQTML
ncbi:hypothetical protein M427DRAFT_47226 [Gonapodya prolifera JEL478]|uniref:Uncharacterized protein n=1 Tax=Gonapodya prolifera (strain JEL478) TaxID=1344416 RepID=A0A139A4F8_GONPJ|nr:hypothetical protein M427DRAFT_47226 [Gonapodya prolifera JEL478]|eukprot:KXS11365.1 hypothetical protein M427DRAFT_47226 [Gonapodya prolifera JEL478]